MKMSSPSTMMQHENLSVHNNRTSHWVLAFDRFSGTIYHPKPPTFSCTLPKWTQTGTFWQSNMVYWKIPHCSSQFCPSKHEFLITFRSHVWLPNRFRKALLGQSERGKWSGGFNPENNKPIITRGSSQFFGRIKQPKKHGWILGFCKKNIASNPFLVLLNPAQILKTSVHLQFL